MTYLDKYKEKHPGLSEDAYQRKVALSCPRHSNGWILSCPGYLPGYSDASLADKCRMCWNQEIPEAKPANKNENTEREDKTVSKKFTKADIKVGYVVKCRNGEVAMAMYTHSCGSEKVITALRVSGSGWGDLGDYTDDMRAHNNNDYDIMEVYGYSKYAHKCMNISTEYRELLWKREEPKKTCDDCVHKVVCSHVGMCEHFAEKRRERYSRRSGNFNI